MMVAWLARASVLVEPVFGNEAKLSVPCSSVPGKNTTVHLLELLGGLLLDAFDRTRHRQRDGWDVVARTVEVEPPRDFALLLGVAEA